MDYIIIVAGGKGLRMGSEVPKQFLPIGGKPVLMRTMERFREYDGALRIILVLPREQQDYWQRLCKEHRFDIGHTLVDGGDTRFASSRNGLRAIPDEEEGIVGIHDGVRPFVSVEAAAAMCSEATTASSRPRRPSTSNSSKGLSCSPGSHGSPTTHRSWRPWGIRWR